VSSLFAAPGAWARSPALHGTIQHARLVHACPPPQPLSASCFAVLRQTVPSGSVSPAVAGAAAPYVAGDGALTPGSAGGLTPALLASAYGYDPVGGSGQTVAIVDAYDDPKIEADLAIFDSQYGLGECSKANGCFRKVNQEGSESTKALPARDKIGWSQEISLDVDTVRAVCQECKILLVEADNEYFSNLAKGVDEAVALGATEVSNSYGGPEQEMGVEERAAYEHPGVVITAATGDDGYDDWNYLLRELAPPGMPNAPSSLPSVVSVGGTSLYLNEDGGRADETVWNDDGLADALELPAGYVAAGGCSTLFAAQPWQLDALGFSAAGCAGKRLAADVAADADPLTGFDIYDNYNYCGTALECKPVEEAIAEHGGWQTFGGTSLSAPMIASLYALAGGGAGLHDPALTLYGHLGQGASLYDVTEGGNGFCDGEPAPVCGQPNREFQATIDCEGTTACNAAPGYDGPTGVGTPIGLQAFKPLFPTAVLTAPTTLLAGTPAVFGSASSSDPYPGATITRWSWNWGDGSPESHEADPAHTYLAAGSYTVGLTVSDSYGLTSVASDRSVEVVGEAAAKKKHEEEEVAARKREEEEAKKTREQEEALNTKHEEELAETKKHEEQQEQAARNKHQEEEQTATTKKHEEQQEQAARNQHREEETATTRKHEEEAAATKKHEEEKTFSSPGVQQIAAFRALESPVVPDARLASTVLVVSPSGTIAVKVSCPAAESTCLGTVTLRTLVSGNARFAHTTRSRAGVLALAAGSFTVAGGKLATLELHLSAKARALLARSHLLRARAIVVAHDPAGATHTEQAIVTLRLTKGRAARH
jgi:PKD repeat protein